MSDKPDYSAEIAFVLDRLVDRGWVRKWGVVAGDMRVEWTERGAVRMRLLLEIDRELEANEQALTVMIGLAKFCPPPGDLGGKSG